MTALLFSPYATPSFRRITVLALLWVCVAALFGAGCAHTPRSQTPGQTPTAQPRPAGPPAHVPEVFRETRTEREPFPVRIQYLQSTNEQILSTQSELVITARDLGLKRVPAGTWRVSGRATAPTRFAYPVFVKSFKHNETDALQQAFAFWRQKGYSPFITTMGRTITARDGTLYDGRLYWLALKRCSTQAEADALKRQLADEKTWSWTREEVVEEARAIITLRNTGDQSVIQAEAPVTFRSVGAINLQDARKGQTQFLVPGPIETFIDRTGALAFHGELPVEAYLQGILPAEVYPSWPMDALKAQAVAARSEIIVHAAGKHYFEGFDFCIEQHCRAFAGHTGEAPRTNEAVALTAGEILVGPDHGIVPTVFSSNCGGWTESNENVWDGDADPALRGRPDCSEHMGRHAGHRHNDVSTWLNGAPRAYCDQDKEHYRWNRSIPLNRISASLNREYGIGNLVRVEDLERGVSGRLKAIRVVGDRKSAEIRKELNIRRAFENLPSALCTISVTKGTVQIRGAGRGHGVGLCQHGAYGMAMENVSYDTILRHYFSGARLVEL